MREDWIEVELQDVFETVTGNTPSKKEIDNYGEDIPFIKPPDISNGVIKSVSEYLSLKGKRSARILPKKSVLVTCIGNLGRIGYNKEEVAFNQQINAILPISHIEFKYTFYQAQSASFRHQLESLSTSTTVALVNKSSFNSLKIVIAPLPIQRAIVSKIEALFSDLDNGIANFKTAQEQLKIYRQAVLKKAFEGELTKTQIKNKPLSELTSLITKGASPKWQGFDYTDNSNELLFITSENVREGFISLEKEKYLPLGFNEIQKRSVLKNGDLLFNIVGASIGRAAIFKLDKLANINQAVALIRLNDEVSKQYVNYFLNSEISKQEYLQKQVDVARANLSLQNVAEIEIPFCSLHEQTQIVQEIESRLSVCDKMEQSITESIEKAEALRQSILKKAFEGKLLSEAEIAQCKQAADYEPASELLKKIQAEKLAKEQEKKKKPTVKKKSKK